MSGHQKFSKLRDRVLARPGGAEMVAEARVWGPNIASWLVRPRFGIR
ncbi:MAG: hypothetical protein ACI8Y4_003945 [Candidatus Poriferisodalaceae bacterium]|jgi:hypothetical protein